jgi:hypothetical protein
VPIIFRGQFGSIHSISTKYAVFRGHAVCG